MQRKMSTEIGYIDNRFATSAIVLFEASEVAIAADV